MDVGPTFLYQSSRDTHHTSCVTYCRLMPRSFSCRRAWCGPGLRGPPVAETGCCSVLRSQLGAGDWGLHRCWLCLCMAIRVRVPVGVRMAVLLCRRLAILAAVLAARRDVLLRSMPDTAQPPALECAA